MSETELLTPEELRQARETRFTEDCGEVFDIYQRKTREKVIVIGGLMRCYDRDPHVRASLQSYLSGDTTLSGSLLLAHRALTEKYRTCLRTLAKHGISAPGIEIVQHTIESIEPGHVVTMVLVADMAMRAAIDAEHRFGMPQMAVKVRLCANCRDRQTMPRNQSPQHPGHSGPCGDVEVVPS
jgi:hypothetical protein